MYRGIGIDKPKELLLAKRGIAMPLGGHSDPDAHNWGDNESIFTSWSSSVDVARKFANFAGPGGVILKKEFKLIEVIPTLTDRMKEGEFLVPGPVYNATPIQ